MPTRQQCDDYASEVARRFEEFTGWAIANWPDPTYPLLSSDFMQSRKEIGAILGNKLRERHAEPPMRPDNEQYLDVNPAPWP